MNNIKITVSGPTGSGKSTIAAKILVALTEEGFPTSYVGMEDIIGRHTNCRNIIGSTKITVYEKQEPRK